MRAFFGLLNEIKAYIFWIYKLKKNIIIDKNKKFIFSVFQIILSAFKSFDNGCKIIIIGFCILVYPKPLFPSNNLLNIIWLNYLKSINVK